MFQALQSRFASGSLHSRIASGASWTAAGSVVFQLCAMASGIATARVLGNTAFGELGMIRSTVVTFGIMAGTGLSLPATKYIAELRTSDPARAGRVLGLILNVAMVLGGATMLLFLFFAGPVSARILEAGTLAGALRVGAVLMLLSALSGVQTGALAGLEEFRTVAFLFAGDGAISLVATVAGAWLYGVTGAIAGAVIAALIVLPVRYFALVRACRRHSIEIGFANAMQERPVIWASILPALLLGVSTQPFEWLSRVLLARGDGGYAELGIFTAAYAWGTIVTFVATQVTGPALPILANGYGSGETARFLSALKGMLLVAVGSAVACAVPLVLFSKLIMRSYGPAFAAGWSVLAVYVLAQTIMPVSGIFRAALIASGNMWTQNLHAVVWGVALMTSLILLPLHGALALAASYAIAFAVVVVTQGASVYRAVRRMSVS